MRLLIDPDELSPNSLLPQFTIPFEPNPELESLTGADFAIAEFPLPINESTLEAHIKDGTIFVQRKSGYDFIGNFEQAHREIARIQACKIPMRQAFILAIGHYKPDDNGLLRITGKRPLDNNKSLKYETFLALEAEYRLSGVNVVRLNDESEIETWINAQVRELETIRNRGNKKELFTTNNFMIYEPGNEPDYLQEVVEVSETDIRYFLACGLKGFGQSTANNLVEYCQSYTPNLDRWGVYALKVLTDLDEKGKPVHNVKGWGKKGIEKLRLILGLPDNYNLDVREIEFDSDKAYMRGWNTALEIFLGLVKEGKPATEAWQMVKNNMFELMES